MESAPVSAKNAASGGATGLGASKPGATGRGTARPGAETPKQPSIYRRHPLATGIAAGLIAVVLVSGLTAWAVGAAVTASLTSATSTEMPMGTATPAPTAGSAAGMTGAATTGRLAFRATIQSMDGDSWTILTKKGKTVTVAVDATTQFGTRKTAETAGSFAVGDNVVIVASRGSDGTPIATRVVEAPTGS
jgi:hypothetical protein